MIIPLGFEHTEDCKVRFEVGEDLHSSADYHLNLCIDALL